MTGTAFLSSTDLSWGRLGDFTFLGGRSESFLVQFTGVDPGDLRLLLPRLASGSRLILSDIHIDISYWLGQLKLVGQVCIRLALVPLVLLLHGFAQEVIGGWMEIALQVPAHVASGRESVVQSVPI